MISLSTGAMHLSLKPSRLCSVPGVRISRRYSLPVGTAKVDEAAVIVLCHRACGVNVLCRVRQLAELRSRCALPSVPLTS
jgi:hypothetical protein